MYGRSSTLEMIMTESLGNQLTFIKGINVEVFIP